MFYGYNYLYNRKNNIFDSVNFINKLTPEIIKDFSIDFFLKKNTGRPHGIAVSKYASLYKCLHPICLKWNQRHRGIV